MAVLRASFIVFCLVGGGTAYAQMGAPPTGAELDLSNLEVESFVWQKPAKWYPYSHVTDAKKVTMLFPAGQKPNSFKESLVFTEFSSTLGAKSADQVKDIFLSANAKKCTTHNFNAVQIGGLPPSQSAGRSESRPPRADARGEGGETRSDRGSDRPAPASGNDEPEMENGYSVSRGRRAASQSQVCNIHSTKLF